MEDLPVAWPAISFSKAAKAELLGKPLVWEAVVEGFPLRGYLLEVVLLMKKTLIYLAIS
jgi:hypothetical protein